LKIRRFSLTPDLRVSKSELIPAAIVLLYVRINIGSRSVREKEKPS
jgi:hypothetical protein